MRLVFSTTNQGKLAEMRMLGKQFGIDLIGVGDVMPSDQIPEIAETGTSYEENSKIKGDAFLNLIVENRAIAGQSWAVLADDAGIEVAALSGAPGVYSARFAGPAATSEQNRLKLLAALEGVSDRRAKLVSVLYCISAAGNAYSARGELAGRILTSERSGRLGFGYDTVFSPDGYHGSLAQVKSEDASFPTHRLLAFRQLLKLTGLPSSKF